MPQAGGFHIPVDADVHRHYIAPVHMGHVTDTALTLGQVFSHQGGDAAVGLGNSLGHHAVVGTEHRHGPLVDAVLGVTGEGGDAHDIFFQHSQTAQGFCNGAPFFQTFLPGFFVSTLDAGAHLLQSHCLSSLFCF